MIDPTKKLTPGQPLRLSARAFNQTVDSSNEFMMARTGKPSALPPLLPVTPHLTVMVLNNTGLDLEAGYVVAVPVSTSALAHFPSQPLEVNRRPYLTGTIPAGVSDAAAILIEPADEGECVRAVILGVVTCNVNILSASHIYATPTIGSVTTLTSANYGPIRILRKASTGTGSKLCTVLLEDGKDPAILRYCLGANRGVTLADADSNGYYEDGTTAYNYLLASTYTRLPMAANREFLVFGQSSARYTFGGDDGALGGYVPPLGVTVSCQISIRADVYDANSPTAPDVSATRIAGSQLFALFGANPSISQTFTDTHGDHVSIPVPAIGSFAGSAIAIGVHDGGAAYSTSPPIGPPPTGLYARYSLWGHIRTNGADTGSSVIFGGDNISHFDATAGDAYGNSTPRIFVLQVNLDDPGALCYSPPAE